MAVHVRARRLAPAERQQYLARMANLSQQNVITSKGFLDLFGYSENGEFLLAPNSYSRGYQDSFKPSSRRPVIALNLLGLFGQLSDGSWIFIPSYTRGLALGNERQTSLKFAILAEGEKRLFQELHAQKESQLALEDRLKDALERVNELERKLGKATK